MVKAAGVLNYGSQPPLFYKQAGLHTVLTAFRQNDLCWVCKTASYNKDKIRYA